MHVAIVLLILFLTYAGMVAGRIAWLRVDRTGIALMGVIVLLGTEAMTLDDIGNNIDLPTLALLFAMMIISAQFAASGFFDLCARTSPARACPPPCCSASRSRSAARSPRCSPTTSWSSRIAPLMIAGVRARGLTRGRFDRACRGEQCRLGDDADRQPAKHPARRDRPPGFLRFLAASGPGPVALLVLFATVAAWPADPAVGDGPRRRDAAAVTCTSLDRNQTIKGAVAVAALLALFATPLPREIGALIIAALLLANRKFTSRTMIAPSTGLLLLRLPVRDHRAAQQDHRRQGSRRSSRGPLPNNLALLLPLSLLTSNAIGNVPATMLLLQIWPTPPPGCSIRWRCCRPRRQPAAERQPDQPADRRARRQHGGAAEFSRLCPRRHTNRAFIAGFRQLLAGSRRRAAVVAAECPADAVEIVGRREFPAGVRPPGGRKGVKTRTP